MGNLVEFYCATCGVLATKNQGEYNRSQRLNRRLFCSQSCSAVASNVSKRAKEIILDCPYCGERFVTSTHNKAKKFCSRSCASKGSMSESRREAQRLGGGRNPENLISTEECLRRREAWKYVALKEELKGREYTFEFRIGKYVFDLVLFDRKVIVEFDGPYHKGPQQAGVDVEKEKVASEAGYILVRRCVESATVISPTTIEGL